MTRPSVLVDTSFLYALFDERDVNHRRAEQYAERSYFDSILPDVVLVEAAYLANRNGGAAGKIKFYDFVRLADFDLAAITHSDLVRVREITAAYPAANFDFVDCCLMALAERLTITQVCTFDRRDFSIFRPRHCDYLELLP